MIDVISYIGSATGDYIDVQFTVMNVSDIISALPNRFEAAQSSGDLFFFQSEVSKHKEIGVEVCFHPLLSLVRKSDHAISVGDSPMYCTSEKTACVRTY